MTAAGAARQRRRRQRALAGLAVFKVKADENGLAEALIAAGRLTPDQTARCRQVEHELS
jgi:hypothetical protein